MSCGLWAGPSPSSTASGRFGFSKGLTPNRKAMAQLPWPQRGAGLDCLKPSVVSYPSPMGVEESGMVIASQVAVGGWGSSLLPPLPSVGGRRHVSRFKAEITLQESVLRFDVFLLNWTLGGAGRCQVCRRVNKHLSSARGAGAVCPAESPGLCTWGTLRGRRHVGDELRRPPYPMLLLLVSCLQTPF